MAKCIQIDGGTVTYSVAHLTTWFDSTSTHAIFYLNIQKQVQPCTATSPHVLLQGAATWQT